MTAPPPVDDSWQQCIAWCVAVVCIAVVVCWSMRD